MKQAEPKDLIALMCSHEAVVMRLIYLTYPPEWISESLIRKSTAGQLALNSETVIRNFELNQLAQVFPLSWTHYIHLMRRSRSPEVRAFYEAEALRSGWSVRQLARQISSEFSYVLEFLNLKDEYSESDLEGAFIHRLEDFLLELGGDFTFVGLQRRHRIDDQHWSATPWTVCPTRSWRPNTRPYCPM